MAEKDDIRQSVRDKLRPFILDFDKENRGNRISAAIISGLGGFLEDLIVGLIEDLHKEGNSSGPGKPDISGPPPPLQDRFTKLMKDHRPTTAEPPSP
jgi:hypothetical protein